MKPSSSIAYYITAHGYGHGVRSCDIINALQRAAPDLFIHVISDLPVDFLRSRLDLPLDVYRVGSFDVGMVQLDSIRVDVALTLNRVTTMLDGRSARIAAERAFLRNHRVGLVVCDIPAMPIEAAKAEGIPALAVGNFAWDWIYEEFIGRDDRWRRAVETFRAAYAQTDLLLRLPFSEPMAAFPRQENVPLVARPGKHRRAELARAYGIDPGKTWVLLSFTTLDWDAGVITRLEKDPDHVFLTVLPLGWPGRNFVGVDRHRFSFSDVIATTDIVVSKPGYGILSDCVVNDKPLVYAERTDFREYPILETALKQYLRHVHIPAEALYRGELTPYLTAAVCAPPAKQSMPAGGDELAAERMRSFCP